MCELTTISPLLKIINNTDKTIHYTPELSMGIIDIWSLGYYNVKKSIMFFDQRGNNTIPSPHIESLNYIPVTTTRLVKLKREQTSK